MEFWEATITLPEGIRRDFTKYMTSAIHTLNSTKKKKKKKKWKSVTKTKKAHRIFFTQTLSSLNSWPYYSTPVSMQQSSIWTFPTVITQQCIATRFLKQCLHQFTPSSRVYLLNNLNYFHHLRNATKMWNPIWNPTTSCSTSTILDTLKISSFPPYFQLLPVVGCQS